MDVLINNGWLLLRGASLTLWMSAASIGIAATLGLAFALVQVFAAWPLRALVEVYLFVMRGVPLLVLLFGMYYALPYAGMDIDPATGGILVISLYFAAFMSEVFRGAILAVPRVQWDAGRALGMHGSALMTNVVLPQAVRTAGPPFINTCIMIVKGTSLVSIIGLWDLTQIGRQIVERTLAPFSVFGGVALIYFFICFALSLVGRHLERRFGYVH
ncbi:amino acid ABC transporter permease [Xanthobacter sp. KR7-225]|uniref:amino acid ABC transporter permease n=1 Tax=Xanthobacter sp. KR7-225 TaxID=3156613 RepID=UPI0032B48275